MRELATEIWVADTAENVKHHWLCLLACALIGQHRQIVHKQILNPVLWGSA